MDPAPENEPVPVAAAPEMESAPDTAVAEMESAPETAVAKYAWEIPAWSKHLRSRRGGGNFFQKAQWKPQSRKRWKPEQSGGSRNTCRL